MERKFKLLPPLMPSQIFYESAANSRQKGFQPKSNSFPVTDLSEEETEEYGEFMKQTFIQHWKNLRSALSVESFERDYGK